MVVGRSAAIHLTRKNYKATSKATASKNKDPL
jgi:hypothetical protein